MNKITIEIYIDKSWKRAAQLQFLGPNRVALEYDLDYATTYLGRGDRAALSLNFPVTLDRYDGPLPGFIIDLVPQGEPLQRIQRRYKIKRSDDVQNILAKAPLASPGNIRIAEPWQNLDRIRESYNHPGFDLRDILQHQTEFVHYMEEHGAPIGGTSGAGGGSPKFLLRRDHHGKFHADGMLPDERTSQCYLVKFPYTDSDNSRLISRTEKIYYDILRSLPLATGGAIEMHHDILFISRFDRFFTQNQWQYWGLESLYSAHNINEPGARLSHEENIVLLQKSSTQAKQDILEYVKRDIVNQLLANTDNHGRNTSLLKRDHEVLLSPLYDVTAMQFFAGDFIVELTRWQEEHRTLSKRCEWISSVTKIDRADIKASLREFFMKVKDLEETLSPAGVPIDFVQRSQKQRRACLSELKQFIEH